MKVWNCAEKIRVLVVDDHPTVREGLRSLIDRQQDVVVCGESANASDALAKVAELRPDVATVDLNLGSESGLELIARMRAMAPALKILALTLHEDSWHRESAAIAGAHDYVTKREATQSLVAKIRQVIQPKAANRIIPQDGAPENLVSKPTSKFNPMKNIIQKLRSVAAVIVMCGVSSVQAATLTAVPMQGTMVMPMVAYHADDARLHVTMPTAILTWGLGALSLALAAFSAVRFLQAEQTKAQIMYATLFILGMHWAGLVKMFAWEMVHRHSVKREIKRMELRVAKLCEGGKTKQVVP